MTKNKQFHFLFRQLTALLIFMLPMLLWAQEKTDYAIQLHSRVFIPIENIITMSKNMDLFTNSFFNKKNYVVIQFKQLPTEEQKEDLATKGIKLFEYIPTNGYTASVSANTKIEDLKSPLFRSIFYFLPTDKTVPAILNGNEIPPYAIQEVGKVDLNVITYEKLEIAEIASGLEKIGAIIIDNMPMFETFIIRVPQNKMQELVALPFVQWAEFVDAPNQLENTLGRTLHRVTPLNNGVRDLNGDSVNVGIWDGGAIGAHVDFSPSGRVTQVEVGTASTHSTHCSGTILGRGILNPNARGMASNANLFSYNFNGNIQTEMSMGIPTYNLVVSSHSYGSTQTCGLNGSGVSYSSTSRSSDLNLNTYPFHIHCHSAGNSQSACAGGWSTITASGKSAKNNILVASITTTEALSSFSSCGPVQDGRVKPEISAFGASVLSTYPNDTYATISGTSMATPGIAGSATVLVQRYKQLNANLLPPSSLIKNIILNTAQDLGNPGPDYRYGYGRINTLEAVKIIEQNRYVIGSVTTGNTNTTNITVPAGAAKLRVMLTWNDPAGAANANPALVNNLNLKVVNGATTTLPWILDPNNPGTNATRGVDVVSNIEQVTIDNPTAGSYTLEVNGLAVPIGPSQQYSLTWSVEMPSIELIYPNGNECLAPGVSETITWNNAGVTANQTIQYSLNNGSSWTTLSSSISPSTTRYTWNVPSANTSTARIRITSGSIVDQSDTTFKILGTPTGFAGNNSPSCYAGQLNFSWSASTNATHYDLFKLNDTTGFFDLLASNVAGTTYTAAGLPSNTNMWFAIVAKNNTSGAISPRSLAINLTTSSSGAGPATPTIGVTQPTCDTAKGTITVTSPVGATLEYSIDGINFQAAQTFINVLPGNYNVTVRNLSVPSCVSAPTPATVNMSLVSCGGTANISVGVQNFNSSILEGGVSNINYFVNNVGTSPSTGVINLIISKPTNGSLTFILPSGWIITSNTVGSTFLQSSNVIQPGLANQVTIPSVYTHNNTNEDAIKSSNIKAQGGSGGEVITNDNVGQTFIQIN